LSTIPKIVFHSCQRVSSFSQTSIIILLDFLWSCQFWDANYILLWSKAIKQVWTHLENN